MTIQNEDWFLVNRGAISHKIKYEKIKNQILDDTESFVDAPDDGKQYGRKDSQWTEIVHTPEYTDADVDTHLNVSTANAGQILSWNGSDYSWVVDQSGGGGGNGGNAEFISYTYPSGQQRTVQNRLEDSVSVKDFGAKGDGVTDDSVAFQAAIQTGRQVNVPAGEYILNSSITSSGRNVTLIGEGSRNTVLQFDTSGDGFSINIDQNNNADFTAHFEGFRIHNRDTGAGVAIRIATVDPVGEIFNMAIVENVHVDGRWTQGIVLDSCRMSKLRNITLGLQRATEGIALINRCMDSVLSNIVCSNVLNGNGAAIFINGEAEGIHIQQSTIINCTVGISAVATGFEPSLFVSDTHTNCRRYGVFAKNFGQLNIHDNLFYAWTTGDASQIVSYNGIYVEDAGTDSVIANNIFHHAGRDANPGVEEKGIVWNSSSPFANISGNMFFQGEVGIEALNNVDELYAGDNHFNGVTDPYRASSGNIASSSMDITETRLLQEIRNTGSRTKNVGVRLINNDNKLTLSCSNDGGGILAFQDNLQFKTNIGNTSVESFRLNDDGTARFYSDLFVCKNGAFDQNLSVNGNFNVVGQSDFSQDVNVSGNVVAAGNVIAGNNLYVGEAGNPSQQWLISVDSSGNVITVRQ